MLKVRTEENNCNESFDHHGDNHRQDIVFDKGTFGKGLSKKSRPEPKHSDLGRRRWHSPFPDRREQRQLIRDAKAGDERAKHKVLEAFHRLVLKIANQYSGPSFEDLMAAGLAGLWVAVTRFNENRGNGLEAYAPAWIEKYIKLEVKRWSRDGAAGETRQDRFLYSNPGATAQEIKAAAGGSLRDAHWAIDRSDTKHDSYTEEGKKTEEGSGYQGWSNAPEVAASHDMCRTFRCFSRYQLSPQLLIHEPVCGRRGRLGWIDECVLYHEKQDRRRLDKIGRRQYALELVGREKIVASFRNKQSRYLYRTDTDLKVRCQIAARINMPVFAEVLTFDQPKTFEVSLAVAMEDKRRSAIIKNMQRLRALRLALGPRPKPKRKQLWPDTQAAIRRENSFHSRSLPPSPVPPAKFAKRIFGPSAIYAGLRCSVI